MLTTKQAQKKIEKFYNKSFKDYEEHINWFPDYETNKTYSWNFEIGDKRLRIECDKQYGTITLY
jgi:hypothetical protein